MEEFGGDGEVARDEFADGGGGGVRGAEFANDFGVNGGAAGEGADAADEGLDVFVLEKAGDEGGTFDGVMNRGALEWFEQDLMGAERATDHEVGRHGVRKEKANGGGMFGPDFVQEFEAGEGTGFEVDENDVELDLLELAEGVVGAVADVGFPGGGQLREVRLDLGKGGQIIVHHQNPTKLFHLYTVPALAGSVLLSGLRVSAFKLSTCQEGNLFWGACGTGER